jgi:hypothetical protein
VDLFKGIDHERSSGTESKLISDVVVLPRVTHALLMTTGERFELVQQMAPRMDVLQKELREKLGNSFDDQNDQCFQKRYRQ